MGLDSIVAAVGTLTDTATVDWLAVPLEIEIVSPASGSEFAIDQTPLITGQAILSTDLAPVVDVTLDGQSIDSFDAAGNFFAPVTLLAGANSFEFTATDAQGRVATTTLTLNGVEPSSTVDFANLEDVSGAGQLSYARSSFDRSGNTLLAEATLTNIGNTPLAAPVQAVFVPFRPLAVTLDSAEGTTPEDEPFVAFDTEITAGVLPVGATSSPLALPLCQPSTGPI